MISFDQNEFLFDFFFNNCSTTVHTVPYRHEAIMYFVLMFHCVRDSNAVRDRKECLEAVLLDGRMNGPPALYIPDDSYVPHTRYFIFLNFSRR